MPGNDGVSEKIGLLREAEAYGYQAAYYVLQDHGLAAEATKEALLALGGEPAFFAAGRDTRRAMMRTRIRSAALAVKRESAGARGRAVRP